MKVSKFLLFMILLAANGYASASGYAIFAKIEGVAGESVEANHMGWSNVESFSYVLERNSAQASAAQRARVLDIHIEMVKPIDTVTPALSDAVAKGTAIPRVVIEVCTGGQAGVCRLRYELEKVRITGVTIKSENQSLPLEAVSLEFEKILLKYVGYSKTGAPTGSKEFNWNMENWGEEMR